MGQFLEKEVSQPMNDSRDKPLLRMQAVATACVYFRRFYSRFDNKHLLLTHKKLGSQSGRKTLRSKNPGKWQIFLCSFMYEKHIYIVNAKITRSDNI
jgi:hypothetical protein